MQISTKILARCTYAVVIPLVCSVLSWGQGLAIDVTSSKLTVYVSKAGFLSAFADNHQVEAPISEGLVDTVARRVTFNVDSRRMKVLDPQMAPDKRRQVQERMLGPEVLDSARFPRISFESTSVEKTGPGRLLVRGQLSLHGVTRPVVVQVREENGHYLGNSTFKQREFGITPVSVAGGTVKVKDELKIEFDISTNPQSAGILPR